jgi:hypothetical protein
MIRNFVSNSAQNIIREIKSRRMRLGEDAACMAKCKVNTKFWSGNLKGRNWSGDM